MTTVDIIFNTLDDIKMVLLYTWPFILLGALWLYRAVLRKWPVDVIIIEKRGNNLVKTNDRAGRYSDPYTELTGYKLQKAKDTIPIVNYEWVMHNVVVETTKLEKLVNLLRGNIGTIFLFKYGSKQYKPIMVKTRQGLKKIWKEIKNKDGSPLLVQVYEQFDPRLQLYNVKFEVIDWDNMNFMIQEQRATIERRKKKENWLKQYLIPLVMWAVSGLICIIMIYYSYEYANAMMSKTAPPVENKPAERPNIPIVNEIIPAS